MRVKTVKSAVALILKHSTDKRNKPSAPEPKTSLAEHPALSRSDSGSESPFLPVSLQGLGVGRTLRLATAVSHFVGSSGGRGVPERRPRRGPPSRAVALPPAQASARPASGLCEDPQLPAGFTLASAPEASPRGMPVPSRPHARHLRPFLGWVSQPAARAPRPPPCQPKGCPAGGGVPAARQLHGRSWGSGSRLLPPHGHRPSPRAVACREAHPRSRSLSPAGPHGSVRVPPPPAPHAASVVPSRAPLPSPLHLCGPPTPAPGSRRRALGLPWVPLREWGDHGAGTAGGAGLGAGCVCVGGRPGSAAVFWRSWLAICLTQGSTKPDGSGL